MFDLDPHTIDPNLLAWLGAQGIDIKFNADGRRGAIARVGTPLVSLPIDDLPCVEVGEAQCLPDNFDEQFEQGKQTPAYKQWMEQTAYWRRGQVVTNDN